MPKSLVFGISTLNHYLNNKLIKKKLNSNTLQKEIKLGFPIIFTQKFFKDSSAKKHYPALGEATISGLMVKADDETGLAKKIEPIIVGGALESRI